MKHFQQALIVVFVGLILLTGTFADADAQDAIQVKDSVWTADFREHLTFSLSAESAAEIVEAELLFRVVGRPATSRNDADFTPGTSIEAEFRYQMSAPLNRTYFIKGVNPAQEYYSKNWSLENYMYINYESATRRYYKELQEPINPIPGDKKRFGAD